MPIYLTLTSSYPEQYAWIDADGAEHVLDGTTGYQVERGVRGRWFPGAQWVEDEIPFIPGSVLRGVNVTPLDWLLPLHISSSTPAQLAQRMRDLMYWFEPSRGTGYFRNTAADGATRLLPCRVEKVDFVEDVPDWRKAIVSLHAADPYWYADAPETEVHTANLGTPVAFLSSEFLPFQFNSDVFFAGSTVDNPGQVESWPTWRIVGPGVNPSLRNYTYGEVMTFDRTLGVGEVILIELERAGVNITDGLGTKLFSRLSNPSVAWSIRPRLNNVQIGMQGATAASSVTLTYTPKFLGP